MIPTFTNIIKEKLITEFLGNNLVIALINYPELGLTDGPSQTEAELRRNFTTDQINLYELTNTDYKRSIITVDPNLIIGENVKKVLVTAEFEAFDTSFSEATHVVAIQKANLVNASASNGNNKGDTQGNIIFVEPIKNAPFVIQANSVFEYNFTLISNIGNI